LLKTPPSSGSSKRKLASPPSRASGASPGAPSAALPGKRKAPDANPRQRQYVAGRLAGKSKKQAALDAGYGATTARHPKDKIERKPAVQGLFQELLEEAGVTNAVLARRLRDGLDASVVHHETKYSQREVHVDFSERREMSELVLRVKGLLIDKHQVQMVKTLEEILEESNA